MKRLLSAVLAALALAWPAAVAAQAIVVTPLPSIAAHGTPIGTDLIPVQAPGGSRLQSMQASQLMSYIRGSIISGTPTPGDCVIWVTATTIGDVSCTAGVVTSVSLTMPAEFSVSGSPVTSAGGFTVTRANQTANLFMAGPSSGSPAAPTFRALVGADLPAPSSSTKGGVQSIAPVSHDFLTGISTAGVPSQAQPATGDLSDLGAGVGTALQATPSGTGALCLINGCVLNASNATGTAPGLTAGGSLASDGGIDLMFFGDGADGDLSCSSGTTQLTRDMWWHNVTISGTCAIQNSNGGGTRVFQIHVSGTLDITNAPAGAIKTFVSNGSAGGTTGSGGTASSATSNGTVGAGSAGGGNGSNGGTGAGTAGTSSAAVTAIGGPGGASGASGLGSGGAGGVAKAVGAYTTVLSDVRNLQVTTANWSTGAYTFQTVGQGGSSGASGGGDGTHNGGAGGAGGAGSSGLDVFARTIARGGSTAVGAIACQGGAGGAGSTITLGTNTGGGAGGGGGGGGWCRVVVRTLTGSTATNAIDASGGAGGAGGSASGTGVGGDSGTPAGGGRIDIYNLSVPSVSITATTAAGSANAHSGTTGGGTASATAQRVSL